MELRTGRLRLLLLMALAAGISFPGGLPAAAEVRTRVTLTFDDGTADQLQLLPLLAAHGLRATFYVNAGTIGMPGQMTWEDLARLHAAGHEVGGHGLTHRNLTRLAPEAARHEVCGERETLAAHGLDPATFAYPFAFVDAATARLVADCGYRAARTVGGVNESKALAETLAPGDRFALRTRPAVKQGKTLAALQGYVTAAERSGGGWVVLVFHHICDQGCGEYAVRRDTLEQLFAWLAERAHSGTAVTTVAEAIAGGAAAR